MIISIISYLFNWFFFHSRYISTRMTNYKYYNNITRILWILQTFQLLQTSVVIHILILTDGLSVGRILFQKNVSIIFQKSHQKVLA